MYHQNFSVIPGGDGPDAIWVMDLTGHHLRKLVSAQTVGFTMADPTVRHLMLFINNKPVKLDLATGHTTPLPLFSHDVNVKFAW